MSLEVIGAGLGRTGTLSLKFALEHLGIGSCYHMVELYANGRRNLPLWLEAINGEPQWNEIFNGYQATTDYPACRFYKTLMNHYNKAKVILTIRDADSWFDSVSETIFASRRDSNIFGESGKAFSDFIRQPFGDKIDDRAFMTDYFNTWNQTVIDTVAPERLLVLSPGDGWEPLCRFLNKPVPDVPYPSVHARAQRKENEDIRPAVDEVELEQRMKNHLARLRSGLAAQSGESKK
ncbi:sulfotransferase family protein [Gynuella sunshinyii]|uniref:Sulfotransferase family protein n=1 Tax=Gynuella sunshinyii YC6258 TaxID=1445510 RepID=A0A0C5VSS3_9GAMM|nr:sulfotransferase family protein [Gynuella sunshinyii]AJQ93359.1 hypothetical Protein YC6258_01311 [Gynuella sunshinyii YC6258]